MSTRKPDVSHPASTSVAASADSLFDFPCRFPIKAMGLADAAIEQVMLEIVCRHARRPEPSDVETRLSRGGKWVSVTLTIEAEGRDQLDAIYRDLTAHESIVWVI